MNDHGPERDRQFGPSHTMLKVLGATLTLLAVLVAGVWVLPASHDQGELSGIWRFRVRLDSGRSTVRVVLRQDGEVLSGTYDGSYGTLPIAGTASGDDIEFSFLIRADPPLFSPGSGDSTS